MVMTQEQLAERLRRAREASGLTQERVAEVLGVSRPVVVQIEAGKRAVNSLELAKISQAVGLSPADLLAEKGPITQTLMARFRATAELASIPTLEQTMLSVVRLCRTAIRLEKELELPVNPITIPRYQLHTPQNKGEAVLHGIALASDERGRIGLGDKAPVWDLPGALEPSGIRVAEHHLPTEISGFSFVDEETGPVIVVNRAHSIVRRQFSCAHELCHTVVDRDRGPIVSVTGSKDLAETRADAFAGDFLAPREGVEAQLTAIGKADGPVDAFDIARLAYHFRVSYDAMSYRLQNLHKISATQGESFRKSDEGKKLASELWRNNAMTAPYGSSLLMWVLRVALEAFRKDIISRKKALELGVELGVPKSLIEAELSNAISHETTKT